MAENFDIVFTDLDGTLLNSAKQVSRQTLDLFHALKARGVLRVIATGRSYFSLQKVLADDFPADYLIVSSGAGIVEMRTRQLLFCRPFTNSDIQTISSRLMAQGLDFMVHGQVPENHHFVYHQSGNNNPDFQRRIEAYQDFCRPLRCNSELPARSAQIIAILPDDPSLFHRVAACFDQFQVIRATSPLDHCSIWLEIYPPGVSKGAAARWLCEYLDLRVDRTIGIGNDYNDIDLLDFTRLSYVVANAPQELLERYLLTPSNDEHGVYHALVGNAFTSG